jgi:effector-binding domain-containing protein
MQSRLAGTERIVAELQSGFAPSTYTPVHVRTEPRCDTVCVRGTVTPATLASWLDDAYATLYGALDRVGVAPSGPSAALYSPEIADDDAEPVEAFVPIAEPFPLPLGERTVALGEVPGATVAVLVHAGDYDTIGETYRTLGAWVARHADRPRRGADPRVVRRRPGRRRGRRGLPHRDLVADPARVNVSSKTPDRWRRHPWHCTSRT